MLQVIDEGVELIKASEGLELGVYVCPAGVKTAGYGTTGDKIKELKVGDKITQAQAEVWLKEDITEHVKVLEEVKVPLNPNQIAALASFIYNIGVNAFKRSSLLKYLNEGDYVKASSQFSRWTRAGKKVLPGLVKRREAERKLFLTPYIKPEVPNNEKSTA